MLLLSRYRSLPVVAFVSLLSIEAWAQPTLLTVDELKPQPVDGLSFMGITFTFTVDGKSSPDATYNSFGPGEIAFVQAISPTPLSRKSALDSSTAKTSVSLQCP